MREHSRFNEANFASNNLLQKELHELAKGTKGEIIHTQAMYLVHPDDPLMNGKVIENFPNDVVLGQSDADVSSTYSYNSA